MTRTLPIGVLKKVRDFMETSFEKCGESETFTVSIDEALKEMSIFTRSQKWFTQRRFKNKCSKSICK